MSVRTVNRVREFCVMVGLSMRGNGLAAICRSVRPAVHRVAEIKDDSAARLTTRFLQAVFSALRYVPSHLMDEACV